MSSTYSDNLKIELMGNGDQAGNWGSTTNTNLGTLIEQAISGYVTQAVATGTDTTITIPNGATGVARNMFLELTGTGGASTNLIVPANKKLYFIYNNATSGQVTVKVSGQTGVSVPYGAKVALVSNGTDIVVAENYMVSATLPSPTLTGTPVAPTASLGTNTTQIATTAFVLANGTSLSTIYPIGTIYTSTLSTNPATLFGFGTWVAFGAGRVLLGDGGGYSAGATGGSATTTLITANLPSHSHSATSTDSGHTHTTTWNNIDDFQQGSQSPGAEQSPDNTQGTFNIATNSGTANITTTIGNTGSGTAATTISPYIVVYMWNRTA